MANVQNQIVNFPDVTYTQSKGYVFSAIGGFLLVAVIKAFLFRLDHPDVFYATLACLLMIFASILFLLPPKLVLSSKGIKISSFGVTWMDLPWQAVSCIEMFKTPVVKTMGAGATGGRRAIGFRIHPVFRGKIRPRSGSDGYDAAIVSMWDFSIDRVAEQCIAFWHAAGGTGDLVNTLETYSSDHLQLTG